MSAPSENADFLIACEQLETGITVRAYAIWQRYRIGRTMPKREDISPRDFAGLLRNAALLKVVDDGRDYEFRINGDAHLEAHGISFKDRRVSEIDLLLPGYGAQLKDVCDRVCRRVRPLAVRGSLSCAEDVRCMLEHESVFLPLGTACVDYILIVSVYMPGNRASKTSRPAGR